MAVRRQKGRRMARVLLGVVSLVLLGMSLLLLLAVLANHERRWNERDTVAVSIGTVLQESFGTKTNEAAPDLPFMAPTTFTVWGVRDGFSYAVIAGEEAGSFQQHVYEVPVEALWQDGALVWRVDESRESPGPREGTFVRELVGEAVFTPDPSLGVLYGFKMEDDEAVGFFTSPPPVLAWTSLVIVGLPLLTSLLLLGVAFREPKGGAVEEASAEGSDGEGDGLHGVGAGSSSLSSVPTVAASIMDAKPLPTGPKAGDAAGGGTPVDGSDHASPLHSRVLGACAVVCAVLVVVSGGILFQSWPRAVPTGESMVDMVDSDRLASFVDLPIVLPPSAEYPVERRFVGVQFVVDAERSRIYLEPDTSLEGPGAVAVFEGPIDLFVRDGQAFFAVAEGGAGSDVSADGVSVEEVRAALGEVPFTSPSQGRWWWWVPAQTTVSSVAGSIYVMQPVYAVPEGAVFPWWWGAALAVSLVGVVACVLWRRRILFPEGP